MVGEPGRRVQDELDAYEFHLAMVGLVDECLRLRGVEGEIAEQCGVDVVHAHGPVVGTGDAPEKWPVAGCSSSVNVNVLLGASANEVNEIGWDSLFVSGMVGRVTVSCEKRCGRDKTAQQRQT